ncbi:CerR family C-terminal domain-containing protein [Variovorax sp. ZS18.2.2]|uniref:CerR family C-terminal domain-containing protein n=1 Tax=Variovorax sp. ZS18.2.2 TaxID=2971255 RepID=UPI0021508CFB|nr:CerR family C-terminal domain-containing protein [Variovorax sp. ZS18.2.2]MCR6474863.1 CerR family C-terminal domain-containing protein [Variovorax sp. ZS18.2.2]
MAISTPSSPARTQRTDGNTTRLHILETAGQLFAERGFADATSKEICTRAGTNMAAINYHFNGRDGLYEAVLIEAHRQVVSIDELASLASASSDPRLKLRAFLTHLIEMGSQPRAPWGFRVVLREALSPSPALPMMIKRAVLPKAKLLRGLLGAIVGLPDDHPAVQRALLFTVLPCIVMMVAPKDLSNKVLPALKDTQALADDLMRYVFAGLDAVAKEAKVAEPVAAPATAGKRR